MNTENEIRLRLRFYEDVNEPISVLKEKFQAHRDSKPQDYSVKVNDEHIWFHFKGDKKHYWSPHLHLELESLLTSEDYFVQIQRFGHYLCFFILLSQVFLQFLECLLTPTTL